MENEIKQILTNKTSIDKDKSIQDCTDFECCQEELLFAMKDNYHSFSISLSIILHCLSIAEKEGYVPPIPHEWWDSLHQY